MEVVKIDGKARNEIVVDIETTGLLPWFGDRVTCICARDSNRDTFSYAGDDEHKVVSKFFNWIIKKKKSCLITFNGKHFDIPFIMTRFTMLNRFYFFDEKSMILSWQHIDLHQELKKLTGNRISLDTAAKLMGCDTKSGTGKDAIGLWKQGKFDELKSYCMQDVEVTWQVYQKWKELEERATGQDTSTDEL